MRASTSEEAQTDMVEDLDQPEERLDVDPWPDAKVAAAVEALLFASPDVLTFRAIRQILPEDEVTGPAIREGLETLKKSYAREGRGVVLVEISGGWQIQTREDFFPWVSALARSRTEERITPAAIETLAIIAYKQPITRAEIDAIRGVGSGQIIRILMDKKMVRVLGRVDLPGRPFQYGTTGQFLSHFGLASLRDLPQGKDL